jgi:hypothetical protein
LIQGIPQHNQYKHLMRQPSSQSHDAALAQIHEEFCTVLKTKTLLEKL